MDIRIRAFGKAIGYLAIIVGTSAILSWLLSAEIVAWLLMGTAVAILIYSVYDFILSGMIIEENLKDVSNSIKKLEK